MNMNNKFKSRKLWAFIVTALVIVANYAFTLNIPVQALLYLVGLTASYILGQGYVDAKQQPVKELPIADITNALGSIVEDVFARTPIGKELPLDELTILFKSVLSAELAKMSIITLVQPVAPVDPVVSPPGDPVPISA